MKKFIILATFVAALAAFTSCETYKVGEPAMSAVAAIDGKYVTFGYEGDAISTVFGVQITNTTNDEANRAWMTISDMNTAGYHWQRLFSVRFEIKVDPNAGTFSASSVAATEPRTAWNPYIEGLYGSYGSYYTAGYQWGAEGHTVTVNGRVVPNGANTASGYKADSIEFSYTITHESGATETYEVKGIKKTGWAEDAQEYMDFCDAYLW